MGEVVPNQLFVAGYSRNKISDDKGIKDIFKKYGNIKEVAYKGAYSFVTFSSESEAQNAISALNGQQINGQKLKVDIVDNRKGRRNGPQENDECFKCGKGGHWARECPNRQSPTRRTKYSDSRSRHRRSKRSNSRSRSYSSYSSSHSRRRRDAKKRSRYNRRSRSPRRDNKRKKSSSCRRSQSNSRSRSSVSNKQRQSHKSSSSK
ncbi:unnamed protein product [Paramecium octaurelia]|uniref:Uncharacterized protein n=1 Tax=Paramecium octaurelia TaxID=43137 RepID=A0A8S1YNV2_PAROT|nr:unnamed protein product [Paramecium octaurelia]CAD8166529.1 unnamed protein product [Paramecium octaurelia]CAD8215513.1 unnamed protein product [Paramecium octaurelia]